MHALKIVLALVYTLTKSQFFNMELIATHNSIWLFMIIKSKL
jgi:hypothetical protein